MFTIAADHRHAVLALFQNGERLTEAEVWEHLNDGINSLADVEVAMARLSHSGKLRRGDDDRWELHDPDLSNRPDWATRTDFDDNGAPLVHWAEIAGSGRVSVQLSEEGGEQPVQFLAFAVGRWETTFESVEDALEAAAQLKLAAEKWQQIQAGEHA